MKAVFVIDVDKDELGKAYATITANDITFFAEGVIRPLPNSFGIDIDDPLAIGWNACLRRIMGETE